MNWDNATDRYGSLSIAMHWLRLLLIAVLALVRMLPSRGQPA